MLAAAPPAEPPRLVPSLLPAVEVTVEATVARWLGLSARAARLDWPRLLVGAMQHRVEGICADALRALTWDELAPPSVVDALDRRALLAESRYLAHYHALQELRDLDEELVASLVVVNGAAVAGDYTSATHRLIGDIDLWVDAEHVDRLGERARRLGYWEKDGAGGPTYYKDVANGGARRRLRGPRRPRPPTHRRHRRRPGRGSLGREPGPSRGGRREGPPPDARPRGRPPAGAAARARRQLGEMGRRGRRAAHPHPRHRAAWRRPSTRTAPTGRRARPCWPTPRRSASSARWRSGPPSCGRSGARLPARAGRARALRSGRRRLHPAAGAARRRPAGRGRAADRAGAVRRQERPSRALAAPTTARRPTGHAAGAAPSPGDDVGLSAIADRAAVALTAAGLVGA